ncbi:MAG: hypothetical protein Q7J47_08850 [Azoarcus sp.]|nr:hypothetical protein [Azoarcus sp.]PKO55359.1 MAG: hypothetical protein CVU28_06695 [Betaproteobacteria bacterium HGW-Betaproteobacteria-21]
MVIVMDMQSGKEFREPEAYDEEVLNANWLPRPEVALQLQQIDRHHEPERIALPEDLDAFLKAMYRNQE